MYKLKKHTNWKLGKFATLAGFLGLVFIAANVIQGQEEIKELDSKILKATQKETELSEQRDIARDMVEICNPLDAAGVAVCQGMEKNARELDAAAEMAKLDLQILISRRGDRVIF